MKPENVHQDHSTDLFASIDLTARRIRVFGVVQGVGFRPFVANAARREGIRGSVCNKGSYVEIHAAGRNGQMQRFLQALKEEAPERSIILKMEVQEETLRESSAFPDTFAPGEGGFAIIDSGRDSGSIFVSPDIATCPKCRKELFDPKNRRYLHPFINCTACGPRMTILDAMPYDRERTSMKKFPMCRTCHEEYTTPSDRRYDAQPVCCNDCGPELFLYDLKAHRESALAGGASAAFSAYGKEDSCRSSGPSDESRKRIPDCRGREAILRTREVLRQGGIAAVKGIGGFHLCCDAADPHAVSRLRRLKNRPFKPFAVMVRDLAAAERECEFGPAERAMLTGPQKPILLLRRRSQDLPDGSAMSLPEAIRSVSVPENGSPADISGPSAVCPHLPSAGIQPSAGRSASLQCRAEAAFEQPTDRPAENGSLADAPRVCEGAAPGCPTLGIMLPYAPVQMLLFDYPDGKPMTDCLIMTSGNPSGAPICMNDQEALDYLSPMCDVILTNNRDIRIRADDSVMMYLDEKPYMVRRSRGFAPLPVYFSGLAELSGTGRPCVLGIGGELKNTFCLADPEYLYLSPYIGDLADLRSVKALSAAVARMEDLLEMKPSAVVCDLHPRYNSSQFARTLGLPVLEVQHHYAHILSCMAENDWHGSPSDVPAGSHADAAKVPAGSLIGVAMDGTGYGTDGTIWGGEFMICSYDRFERLGSIEPFLQAGGDRSSKEGWRIAVALLQETELLSRRQGADSFRAREMALSLGLCTEQEYAAQTFLLKNHVNCVTSTSAGRLFDAVSAILGIKRENTFEGEAATALEYAAQRWQEGHGTPELPGSMRPRVREKASSPAAQAASSLAYGTDSDPASPKIGGEVISSLSSHAFTAGSTAGLVRTLCRLREAAGPDEFSRRQGAPAADTGPDRAAAASAACPEQEQASDTAACGAALFHEYLAQTILAGCRRMRDLTGLDTVALSGGCFQNRTLAARTRDLLQADGFRVLLHSLVPPNDGGIALGQAAYGLYHG